MKWRDDCASHFHHRPCTSQLEQDVERALLGYSGKDLPTWSSSLHGRVEMWRGICRSDISVSAPFVWRCLSGPTVAPFPHPAHRTGRADFPHPALGQDLTPLFGVRRHLRVLNPSWSL